MFPSLGLTQKYIVNLFFLFDEANPFFRDNDNLQKEMGHVDKDKANVVDERLWNSEDDEDSNAADDQTREKDNEGKSILYSLLFLSIHVCVIRRFIFLCRIL